MLEFKTCAGYCESLDDAYELNDYAISTTLLMTAISTTLLKRKPVYINISCKLLSAGNLFHIFYQRGNIFLEFHSFTSSSLF